MGDLVESNGHVNSQPHSTRSYSDDDIAVVGMSINVAGGSNVDEFWKLMLKSESQHVEVPPEKFTFDSTNWREVDPTRKWYGNFIQDYDAFDHKFFRKSPREAQYADPQQRLFLQCAYQAVEQSGYFSAKRPDRRVGVYVGVGSAEYEANFACHQTNAFSATGNLKSAIAGRVSHFFGWTGPGLAIDTACSASAVAMNLGCRAILSGECTAALVGGTQMLTSPFHFQNLAGASFLSPTGACKPFDAEADGYCRGEGIGAVFLKKMGQALADGDMVIGCIASTGVLQNDNSTPMFVPNADSLANLFQDVVQRARLTPKDVTFVEAHGTGTKVGDPAEYESIRRVLGGSSGRQAPLPVCSVKSLVGHTECASGIVSLIKVLMMMHNGLVPLQTGFKRVNPALHPSPLDMLEIPKHHKQWDDNFRAALINSFGASGSNSAMVVTKIDETPSIVLDIMGRHPFWLTGSDARSIRAYANKLGEFIRDNEASVADISYCLSRQSNRTLPKGLILHASTRHELLAQLDSLAKGNMDMKITSAKPSRPVILCFGGQTSTSVGLSRSIFDAVPLLRKYLDQCESILVDRGLGSLYPEIFQEHPIEDTVTLQLALFALQYACAKAWIDCGVEPAALVGHSFGELTCLAISGSLSLEDTIAAVHARATLVQDKFGSDTGSMIAVEGAHEQVIALLKQSKGNSPDHVPTIACYNGPTSFTVAGSTKAIDSVEDNLPQSPGLRGKRLAVSHAFHSPLVDPILQDLDVLSQGMEIHEPSIRWERATEDRMATPITSSFFATHMRGPVHASAAFQRLRRDFPEAIWLEAGSSSTITKMAKKALSAPKDSFFQAIDITGSQRTVDQLSDVSESLWREGLPTTHWLHHPFQRHEFRQLLLPPYQFEKTRHWLELKKPETICASVAAPIATTASAIPTKLYTFVKYLDQRNRLACFRVNSESPIYRQIGSEYTVAQTADVCPPTLAIDIALEALFSIRPDLEKMDAMPEIQNVEALALLSANVSRSVWLVLQPLDAHGLSTWAWEINSTKSDRGDGCVVHFQGEFEFQETTKARPHHELARYRRLIPHETCTELLTSTDADSTLQGRNVYIIFSDIVEYGEAFKGIQKVVERKHQFAGRIVKNHSGLSWFDPHLADCFVQVGAFWVNYMTERSANEIFTMGGFDLWIRSNDVDATAARRASVWDVFVAHSKTSESEYTVDLFVFESESGLLTEVILGVRFAKVPKKEVVKTLTGMGETVATPVPLRAAPATVEVLGHPRLPHEYALATAAALSGVPSAQPSSTQADKRHSTHSPTPATTTEPSDDLAAVELPNQPTEPRLDQVGSETTRLVLQILATLSGVDESEITQETELADIGIDSLVEIELVSDLQKRFQCNMAETQEWSQVITVADLLRCVQSALGEEM